MKTKKPIDRLRDALMNDGFTRDAGLNRRRLLQLSGLGAAAAAIIPPS